jgi:hypothetical protein
MVGSWQEGAVMLRLSQAIAAVMAGTVASGFAGGIVGAAVGRLAPSFVVWFHSPGFANAQADFDPTEFALGLGVVCGLFLGAGASLFLAVVIVVRDAWLARSGTAPSPAAGAGKLPLDV